MSWNLNNFWPLNEASDGSGPVARVDLVVGVELTDVNTVASGEGPNGNTPGAADFVLANVEELRASDATLFDFEDSGESWAFLLHFYHNNVVATSYLFSKWTVANGMQFRLFYSGGLWRWMIAKSGGVIMATLNPVADETWHKVMCWYDHTTGEAGLNINGTEATDTGTALWASRGTKFVLGSEEGATPGSRIDGRIANFGYRSTAWTADEKTEFNSKFMTAEDFGIGVTPANVRTLSNRRMAPIIAG